MNMPIEKEQKIISNNLKNNKTDDPKISLSPNIMKRLVISILVVSFIIGGLSGAMFGAFIGTNNKVAIWFQDNIFNNYTKSNSDIVFKSQTIAITEESATVSSVDVVSPAVVSIIVTVDVSESSASTNNLFNFNFEQPEGKQRVGAGTGFVITSDGLILTNKHVVDTKNAEYTVHMNNGEQFIAIVLDSDPFNDIALIKIEASDLPVVEFGDSDVLQIGQTVIAIGNALGEYSNTVTRGVVSGLSRTVTAGSSNGQSETLEDIIQTDAAINFGNSGGPLINLAGQVIGVNTAISREGQLVGFAIPINQVKKAVESIKEHGKIVRPYLGVRYMLITENLVNKNNLSVDYGALILKGSQPADLAIIPGSPADKAGLEENDIILEVNGQRIDIGHSLVRQLQKYDPGDTVTLKVLHDGEEKIVEATLAEVED